MIRIVPALIAILLVTGFLACRKNDLGKDPTVYNPPLVDTSYRVKTLSVNASAGSSFTVTGTDLYSFQYVSKVGENKKVQVAHKPGSLSTAYLFDGDDNLIMAGFLTDSTTEISPASTAKVLMYWAHQMPFQPYWAKKAFINIVDELPDMKAWVSEYETLFEQDALVFSKGTYSTALKARLDKMTSLTPGMGGRKTFKGSKKITDAGKLADVTVQNQGEKSGLQVAGIEGGKIAIENTYRRRTHAFLYKMDYTDMSGNEVKVKPSITSATAADNDFAITAASGATSVMGIIGSRLEEYMTNNPSIIETFRKTTESPALLLNDNEQLSNYKARIVGPGLQAVMYITAGEQDKLYELQIETFVFDYLLPFFALAASGIEETMPDFKTAQDRELQIAALKTALNSMSDVNDAIKKSEFGLALRTLRDNYLKDIAAFAQSKLGEVILKSYYWDGIMIKFKPNFAKKLNKILAAFDLALGGSDIVRTGLNLASSKQVEEWDMLLKAGMVTLEFVSGHDSLLQTSDETKIQAEIKNLKETGDQHPFFEWSTTGKYGKLVDTKGHSGTSFSTADHIVSYQSTTNSNDLGDGDNIDYIYVKASFNNVLIGRDTIAVNVKKSDYEMKPGDGTVTGKKHANAANSITLYLSKVVTGERDIPSHESLDFKVEWSTSGNYGNLVGATTTYNDDDIVYKATNDQEGVFTETITARVYAKSKSGDDYFLYSNVTGKVKIDNEPKKIIYVIALEEVHSDSTDMYANVFTCMSRGVAFVDIMKDAIKYSVRTSGTQNGWYDKVFNWNAGENPGWFIGYYRPRGISGNQYTVSVSVLGQHNYSADNPHHERLPVSGTAEVTVWLK